MTALTLPAVPIEGGLSRYFREIWGFPILEKEEEQLLAIRWRDKGDTEAAHKLVTSHLRLVAKMAMKYRGYGLPAADAGIDDSEKHRVFGKADPKSRQQIGRRPGVRNGNWRTRRNSRITVRS